MADDTLPKDVERDTKTGQFVSKTKLARRLKRAEDALVIHSRRSSRLQKSKKAK